MQAFPTLPREIHRPWARFNTWNSTWHFMASSLLLWFGLVELGTPVMSLPISTSALWHRELPNKAVEIIRKITILTDIFQLQALHPIIKTSRRMKIVSPMKGYLYFCVEDWESFHFHKKFFSCAITCEWVERNCKSK